MKNIWNSISRVRSFISKMSYASKTQTFNVRKYIDDFCPIDHLIFYKTKPKEDYSHTYLCSVPGFSISYYSIVIVSVFWGRWELLPLNIGVDTEGLHSSGDRFYYRPRMVLGRILSTWFLVLGLWSSTLKVIDYWSSP